jgi:hypothetical protein
MADNERTVVEFAHFRADILNGTTPRERGEGLSGLIVPHRLTPSRSVHAAYLPYEGR